MMNDKELEQFLERVTAKRTPETYEKRQKVRGELKWTILGAVQNDWRICKKEGWDEMEFIRQLRWAIDTLERYIKDGDWDRLAQFDRDLDEKRKARDRYERNKRGDTE